MLYAVKSLICDMRTGDTLYDITMSVFNPLPNIILRNKQDLAIAHTRHLASSTALVPPLTYPSNLSNGWTFESVPSNLLDRLAKFLDQTESWKEIVAAFDALRVMKHEWDETIREKNAVDDEVSMGMEL